MPIQYIIDYFEQLLEDAELEGAANRGELDDYYENRPDRVEAAEKRALWNMPVRSPEPALPPEPLEHTPRLVPVPPQPLPNASETHDHTVRLIGDPILDLQIEECLQIVNGMMMQDPHYHTPPPDR